MPGVSRENPLCADRIRLVEMNDDPFPIEVGQLGTVVHVRSIKGRGGWYQIDVAWDNGRRLMLASPPDLFEIVGHEKPKQP